MEMCSAVHRLPIVILLGHLRMLDNQLPAYFTLQHTTEVLQEYLLS